MRHSNDEFNYVKITNEDENPNIEYGDTQQDESTSYFDNDDSIRDEVNDNPTNNLDNKEPKKEEKKEKKQESSEKSEGNSSSSSGGVSSSSIISVVGASLVAIPTLSVLVGINLYFNGKCKMNKYDVSQVALAIRIY